MQLSNWQLPPTRANLHVILGSYWLHVFLLRYQCCPAWQLVIVSTVSIAADCQHDLKCIIIIIINNIPGRHASVQPFQPLMPSPLWWWKRRIHAQYRPARRTVALHHVSPASERQSAAVPWQYASRPTAATDAFAAHKTLLSSVLCVFYTVLYNRLFYITIYYMFLLTTYTDTFNGLFFQENLAKPAPER